jgi:peptidoglycan/LPS O-acetylase OafA/YrhL
MVARPLFSKIKFPSWAIYLGKISYGLYVWHVLNLQIINHIFRGNVLLRLTALVPTIIMAVISYRYLETPFLKLKNKFTRIQSRAV